MRDRNGVYPDRKGGERELGRVEREETVFFIKKKNLTH